MERALRAPSAMAPSVLELAAALFGQQKSSAKLTPRIESIPVRMSTLSVVTPSL
jgi:hypothetical protein